MEQLLSPIIVLLTQGLVWLTGALQGYGLAILVFTFLVRFALTPLALRQIRSSQRLAALAPQLAELRRRYVGDREGLTRSQTALYKERGVSPTASLLPLLVQIPILWSLFYVFSNLAGAHTPAMFHQAFLWFRLDQPDHLLGPLGPLSIVAGLLQWVQQRMATQPAPDSMQQTIQQVAQLTSFAVVFFAMRYPASLAMYWVTSTLYAIVLQYRGAGWGQLFASPFRPAEPLLATSAEPGVHTESVGTVGNPRPPQPRVALTSRRRTAGRPSEQRPRTKRQRP